MFVKDGRCEWDECETFSRTGQVGVSCDNCKPGFGKHEDGWCYPCSNPDEAWDDCMDCSIDGDMHRAKDCLACPESTGLVLLQDSDPLA